MRLTEPPGTQQVRRSDARTDRAPAVRSAVLIADVAGTAGYWLMPSNLRSVVAAVVVLLAAALTSCGGSATTRQASQTGPSVTSSSGPPAAHNSADVAFARNMIPHHQQAVVLAAMVPAHSANPALRVMATHIAADQQAETRTLSGLLGEWGERVEPGGTAMAGMVDQGTLQRLQSLYDNAFDTLWVTSMIGHHQGAITMAQDEIAHGQSAEAVHVATLIITAQQREIAMMTHMISAAQ
jgi:uncharacterized protein (DUF305 family)